MKEKTKKVSRINIRLYHGDLEKIKRMAEIMGMPYQTLICSVLHKYATNQLKDIGEKWK